MAIFNFMRGLANWFRQYPLEPDDVLDARIRDVLLEEDGRGHAHPRVLHHLELPLPDEGVLAVLSGALEAVGPGAHDEERPVTQTREDGRDSDIVTAH